MNKKNKTGDCGLSFEELSEIVKKYGKNYVETFVNSLINEHII
jgi:hypothetical protein